MAKGWYVLHTYSGYENKIEKYIRKLMELPENSSIITDIKVPSEEVQDVKNGKKRTINRKFLPGYILLEMDMPDLGWKMVCSQIRKIEGVTGFLGSTDGKPRPISFEEARSILQKTGDLKADKTMSSRQVFAVGDNIKIISGAFDSFTGKVEEVTLDKCKLRVMVQIFGRSTPVEVDFDQVEKI